jgi:hypothetical protein
MATDTVESRLTELEIRIGQIERGLLESGSEPLPWWRRIAGRFKDNPEFDEAMRLGREYRNSLRPEVTDNS